MLDHVGLTVSDFGRSRAFYERALAPLGLRVMLEPAPQVAGFGDDFPFFWIDSRDTAKAVGSTHVAFRSDNREAVDAFHEAAVTAGGTDNGAPGERPIYHADYYGAYVLDPDGNNVEAVCHRPAPAAEGA